MSKFSWFFSKSIKVQLTVLIFVLTAVAIVVVGFLGVRGILESGDATREITTAATEERSEQFMAQTTAAAAEKNSIIFKNIQNDTRKAAEYMGSIFDKPNNFPNSYWRYDGNITKLPQGHYTNDSTEASSVFMHNKIKVTPALKRTLELTAYLDFYVPQILSEEKNAVAVYYVGPDGDSRYYPNIGLATVSEADFNPATADFYTVGTPENNPEKVTKSTNVYDDPAGNGLVITINHPIYMANGQFKGALAIDVALSNVAKNIEDYSPIQSSYSFLIDNSGEAIALPVQAYKDILNREPAQGEFGADLTKVTGDFGKILAEMRAGKKGFTEAHVNGSDLYVAYEPVQGTTFSLGIVAQQSSLLAVAADLREQVSGATRAVLYFQILPSAIAILGLIWLLGFMYIRYLTRPIMQLTAETRRIREGDFTPSNIVVKANNELGTLATAFNTMTAELAKSYKLLQQRVRELADGKAKDDAMISSIGDGVIVIDGEGKIVLINTVACTMLGINGNDMLNKPFTDIMIYDEANNPIPDDERPLMVALKTGKKVSRDIHVPHGKGIMRDLKITASPVLQEGKAVGSMEIIRDVTREREIDRMKTDFIAVASHQLRTPLSAIRWFGEMLLAGDTGKLNAQQQEFVTNITQSTKRMIELVGSLLNISRLESGKIDVNPKPTDIKQLVLDITNDMKTEVSDRHQKLLVDIDPTLPELNIDGRMITQVYVNLLNNAMKYTPNGGSISVKVARKGDEILTEIKDTGYGIPKDEQVKVFERFYRGSNIVKVETDGTGLGLYLVKTIIESSGGKVWFESAEGKGTSFFFVLPQKSPVTKAPTAK